MTRSPAFTGPGAITAGLRIPHGVDHLWRQAPGVHRFDRGPYDNLNITQIARKPPKNR